MRNAGTTIGGTNQLLAVSLSNRADELAVGIEIRPSEELVMVSLSITIYQREVKAIPLASGTDRAEIFGTDPGDYDGTHLAEPPLLRMPRPVPLSLAYPSEAPSIRE
jgi:hypothetical protein